MKRTIRFLPFAALILLGMNMCWHPLLNILDPEYQGIIYVSESGSRLNSGLQPTRPMKSISEAVDKAKSIGGTQVRVAQGEYEGGVNLHPGVSLLGGYAPDFSVRDWDLYESRIAGNETPDSYEGGIFVSGSDVTKDVVVEGLTFDFHVSGTPIESWHSYSVIGLCDGASPTIRNNRIRLHTGVGTNLSNPDWRFDVRGIGIHDYTSDSAFFDLVISNNDIWVKADGSPHRACGILIGPLSEGSHAMIEANRVVLKTYDNHTTGSSAAIAAQYQPHGVVLKNNVVRMRNESGDGGWGVDLDAVGAVVANNTIVCDGPIFGGLRSSDSSAAGAQVVNNILACDGSGTAVTGNSADYCDYNLFFNFTTWFSGGITGGGHSDTLSGVNFTEVFSSSLDGSVDDGDDTDYHLYDPAAIFAVDLGTNTNVAQYGDVAVDFEGDSRPQSAAFDRGADEKT